MCLFIFFSIKIAAHLVKTKGVCRDWDPTVHHKKKSHARRKLLLSCGQLVPILYPVSTKLVKIKRSQGKQM